MPRDHRNQLSIEQAILNVRVLRIFLAEPHRARYGFEIMRAADLQSGTVYPMLRRMVRDGWLRAMRPHGERRTFYELTPDGRLDATALLARLRHALNDPIGDTTHRQP